MLTIWQKRNGTKGVKGAKGIKGVKGIEEVCRIPSRGHTKEIAQNIN
jgi:hypothetical protein